MIMPNNPDGNETYCKHKNHADCHECMFDLVYAAQEAMNKTLGEYTIKPDDSVKYFLEMIAEKDYPNA